MNVCQETLKYFDSIIRFDELLAKLNSIKTTKIISHENLNILAFQITFLLDENEKACKMKRILTDDEFLNSFNNYFQKNLGNTLLEIRKSKWENQTELKKILSKDTKFPNYESLLKTCSDDKTPAYVIAGDYGKIDLPNLNKSYSRRQYWIGVIDKSEYADGKLLSPLEFFHHDLNHFDNREFNLDYNDVNTSKIFLREQLFLEKIENDQTISLEEYNNLQIVFCMLTHEMFLGEKYLQCDNISYNPKGSLCHIDRFLDVHDLNDILPDDIKTKSEYDIQKYLTKIFSDFNTKWKQYSHK